MQQIQVSFYNQENCSNGHLSSEAETLISIDEFLSSNFLGFLLLVILLPCYMTGPVPGRWLSGSQDYWQSLLGSWPGRVGKVGYFKQITIHFLSRLS